MKKLIIPFSLFLIVALASPDATAQSPVTINPLIDNTLYETVDGSLSNGIGTGMFAGSTAEGSIRRALVSFDVAASVPAGMVIDSVQLILNMSRTAAAAQTINLHRVTSAWGEGTSNAPGMEGQGAASTTNDATWIHTFYSTSFWTAAGGDYSATVSGSQSVGDNGVYTWGSTSDMVADAQGWLDTPSGNFGWILIGNEGEIQTSKRFDTGEHPTVANRPKLTIWYSEGQAGIPCEDIDFFNSKCNMNGAGQAMVRFLNSTEHAGKTIEFQLDATVYPVVLVTNGTHTLGKISVPHVGMGMHTMTLITPEGCFDPVTFNCQVDRQSGEDEFDRLWAESETWEAVPVRSGLFGNYPNPFNPSTTIRYALSADSRVSLKVYNMLGQEIVTLADEVQSAGEHSVVWNGRTSSGAQVSAGVYLYTLVTADYTQTSKMVILK